MKHIIILALLLDKKETYSDKQGHQMSVANMLH